MATGAAACPCRGLRAGCRFARNASITLPAKQDLQPSFRCPLLAFARTRLVAARAQTRYFTTSALENPRTRRKKGHKKRNKTRHIGPHGGLLRRSGTDAPPAHARDECVPRAVRPDVPRPSLAVKLPPTRTEAARQTRPPQCTPHPRAPMRDYAQHSRRTLAMYQSEITQFLNQLKTQKPELEEQQRKGRALLWDKQPLDLDERERQQASRVRQTPYVYYQNF